MRGTTATLAAAVLLAVVAGTIVGCGAEETSGIKGRLARLDFFGDVVGLEGGIVTVRAVGSEATPVETRSGDDGRYAVELVPGKYVVEIFADSMGHGPSFSGTVNVASGAVTRVPAVRGSWPSSLRRRVDRTLRDDLRAEAVRLGLERHTALVEVSGSHAAQVTSLFGETGLADEARVYVVLLRGEPGPDSPHTPETEALRRVGEIAYLFAASTLAQVDVRVLRRPLSEEQLDALSGNGGLGFLAS